MPKKCCWNCKYYIPPSDGFTLDGSASSICTIDRRKGIYPIEAELTEGDKVRKLGEVCERWEGHIKNCGENKEVLKMKKLLLQLFIVILLSRPMDSWALTDGQFWAGISSREKEAYITGVIDGALGICAKLTVMDEVGDDNLIKKQIKNLSGNYDLKKQYSVSQVVEGTDMFYNDYANKQILVSDVLPIVLKRLRGVSEKELQKEVESLRRAMSIFKADKK